MVMKWNSRLICLFLLILFFHTSAHSQEATWSNWKKERVEELTKEDGWLNLIGLLWLDPSKPYFNQITSDSLALSESMNETTIGKFEIQEDSVWFDFNEKTDRSNSALVYPLEYGKGGGAYYSQWKWTVIERGGKYGVRLRDLEHPRLKNFQELPYYDYDSRFQVQAFFEPKFNQTVLIPNVLGQLIEWKVMGYLSFELDGIKQSLMVLDELGKFFVIFSDETNGHETYSTGRYLYVDYPNASGWTTIDFNYAYNPPCAFSSFATCPIPPKENRMNLEILAGEKSPEGH